RQRIIGRLPSAPPRRPKLIERRVGCDAPHPCAEASPGIELGATPICPPERLHQHIVGGAPVADDAQDPSIDLRFEPAEQLLERSLIALDEPAENLGVWLARHVVYLALLSRTWKGSGMIAILVTGGTFDKQYNELAGTLTFKETRVPEMLRLGRCRVD